MKNEETNGCLVANPWPRGPQSRYPFAMVRRGPIELALRAAARAEVKARLTPVKLELYRQRQSMRRLERSLQPQPKRHERPPSLPVSTEQAILRWMFDEGSRAAHRT